MVTTFLPSDRPEEATKEISPAQCFDGSTGPFFSESGSPSIAACSSLHCIQASSMTLFPLYSEDFDLSPHFGPSSYDRRQADGIFPKRGV